MSDYIKREDAEQAVEDLWDYKTVNGIESKTVLKQVLSDIKAIPTADVEPVRPHGKWIYIEETNCYDPDDRENIYECSECHCVEVHKSYVNVPYCSFCGARMDGEEE